MISMQQLKTFPRVMITSAILTFCAATTAYAEENSSEAQTKQLEQLSLSDMENNTRSLSEYRGKPVLVNFWASWCRPCVKEMPALQRLQDAFSYDEFQVVAVNISENRASIENFLNQQETRLSMDILIDEKGTALGSKLIDVMPSSFVLDADGKVLEKIVGIREWDHPENIRAVRGLIP